MLDTGRAHRQRWSLDHRSVVILDPMNGRHALAAQVAYTFGIFYPCTSVLARILICATAYAASPYTRVKGYVELLDFLVIVLRCFDGLVDDGLFDIAQLVAAGAKEIEIPTVMLRSSTPYLLGHHRLVRAESHGKNIRASGSDGNQPASYRRGMGVTTTATRLQPLPPVSLRTPCQRREGGPHQALLGAISLVRALSAR